MVKKIIPLLFLYFTVVSTVICAEDNLIRVLLLKDVQNFSLSVRGGYEVISTKGNAIIYKGKNMHKTTVHIVNSGIKINNLQLNNQIIEIRPLKSGNIYLNNRRYRGLLRIIKTQGDKLSAINVLDVEDYLRGVLRQEVNNKWPMHILSAQAIAARTYAFYQKERNNAGEYDLTATVSSQVYGGLYSETWATNKAVRETKGKVLTFNDKIFPAYYHACCGGHTEDAGALWEIDIEVLSGIPCNFCFESPHFRWEKTINLDQLETRLNGNNFKVDTIKQIDIAEIDKSGRITILKITDEGSEKIISAKDFRQVLGADFIRSTNFSIEINHDAAIFKGQGWGHGVGMCQWGGYKMANLGYTYDQILYFYYPNSKIKKLY